MTETTSAVRQLSDGNSIGTALGRSTTDKIAFFTSSTSAPIVQPTSSQQAALPSSGVTTNAGLLTHYVYSLSPASVATLTVAEQSLTVTGALSTDMVIINKPSSQAGLALCSSRVTSANTVSMAFANVTAGTLTPTATESYIVTTVPTDLQKTVALTPAAVAASTVVEQSFTSTGIAPGMIVAVNKPTTNAGVGVLTARASANNTLAITFINTTAAVLTPTAAQTYLVAAFNPLLAASQIIHHGVNAQTLASVATVTTAELATTCAGLAATDVAIGVQKPTLQAGLLCASVRVAGANSIGLQFVNPTAGTLTPTASQVYVLTVLRSIPVSPMTLYTSSTITPTSVAANTSAEQTFTVTGLVSGQPVAVSPNFAATQLGVGIGGVRASATNTLAITFVNATASTVTPTAGTYTVAQFNQTTPTAGNYVQQLVTPHGIYGDSLLQSTRSALVNLGLMAGA